MPGATVVSIYIAGAPGSPMQETGEARAIPGKGIEGDRYCNGTGTFSNRPGPDREMTLIEIEALEAVQRDYGIDISPGAARRQVVTRGIALNHLVGREFRLGEIRLRGIRLCEPCAHLAGLTSEAFSKALVHRGGLRAQVLSAGVIRPGDAIEVEG